MNLTFSVKPEELLQNVISNSIEQLNVFLTQEIYHFDDKLHGVSDDKKKEEVEKEFEEYLKTLNESEQEEDVIVKTLDEFLVDTLKLYATPEIIENFIKENKTLEVVSSSNSIESIIHSFKINEGYLVDTVFEITFDNNKGFLNILCKKLK